MERVELYNKEIWKPIPNFQGYEASSQGNIRSVERVVSQYGHKQYYSRIMPGRILKQGVLNSGYCIVFLSINAKRVVKTVHRLIALTFLDNSQKLSDVNHKNGNKTDNRLENLEWVSRSDNIRHSYRCLNRKSTNKSVLCIDTGKIYKSAKEAATQLNLNASGITNAANGHSKSSGGLKWKRLN